MQEASGGPDPTIPRLPGWLRNLSQEIWSETEGLCATSLALSLREETRMGCGSQRASELTKFRSVNGLADEPVSSQQAWEVGHRVDEFPQ